MTDKEKLHQILSSLWKDDDSVGKTYYNQALQDVQTAIDLQEEPTGNPLGSTHAEFRTAVESLGISQEEHEAIVDKYLYGKEDLEEASKEWLRQQLDKSYANYGEAKMMELTHFDGYAMLDAIEFGAEWQKTKDESTTEDLGDYINELSKQFPEVSFAKLSRIAIRVAKWQKEQFEKNRLKHCNSITNEQAELEQGFIDQHLDKHQRMPTFLDAIEYGMRLQEEQIEEALLSEVLPCFMHGGEADEVVAKLEEVLNKKKLGD